MKKINSKGFTMVELLAAIVIMGILMLSAGVAVTIHIHNSKENSYDTMARSAKNAATQYIMEYPAFAMTTTEYEEFETKRLNGEDVDTSKVITFQDLMDDVQLTRTLDPADNSSLCTGKIIAILNEDTLNNERALDSYSFVVHQCCFSRNTKYTFSEEYRKDNCDPEEADCSCDPSIEDNCNIVEVNGEEDAAVWCD